ncbi:MAG: FMN-binding protein [Pseudomonadota bacterium]
MSTQLPIQEKEPSSTTLVAALSIAGFLSGIIIIAVYLATFDTIAENKARELREAVFRVLPGVSQMQKLRFDGEELVVAPAEQKDDEDTIYGGYDDKGNFVGYAIASAGPGFQDTIRVLYGYQPAERKVVGMWILESRETPGLGDKIYKDAVFVANFDDLAIDPQIVTMKKGTKSAPNEIDAITGATISSKAVVRIINEGHAVWDKRLPRPGAEPRLAIVQPESEK